MMKVSRHNSLGREPVWATLSFSQVAYPVTFGHIAIAHVDTNNLVASLISGGEIVGAQLVILHVVTVHVRVALIVQRLVLRDFIHVSIQTDASAENRFFSGHVRGCEVAFRRDQKRGRRRCCHVERLWSWLIWALHPGPRLQDTKCNKR